MNDVLSITAKILALPNLLYRQDSKNTLCPQKNPQIQIFFVNNSPKKTLSAAEVLKKIDRETRRTFSLKSRINPNNMCLEI